MAPVPEIKLIRTDTTLDLSQKAEKVWIELKTPLYLMTQKQILKPGEKKMYFLIQFTKSKLKSLPTHIQHPGWCSW